MDDYHRQLLARGERAFGGASIATYAGRVRAIIGPRANEYQGLAQEAMDALKRGETPCPMQLAALENVIRAMRPAPLSKKGALENLDPDVAPRFPDWDGFRSAVKPFLYSIGRVDRLPEQAIGTGFLIGPGVLVTNRHVLDLLSSGTCVLEPGQAVVRFRYEYNSPDEDPVPIIGVVAVHPSMDVALLRVEERPFADGRRPLAIETAEARDEDPVVAIGYPLDDPTRNPLFIGAIFGSRFGVKRAAPGDVIGTRKGSVFHDCSTLGGNSGSPLLSMRTARVVGVHREGFFTYRNEAVDGASLDALARSI
jgi:endonuclease G